MKDPIVGYDAEGKPFAVFCGCWESNPWVWRVEFRRVS